MANFLADNSSTDPINPYDQSPNSQPKTENPYLTGASRWQNKRLSNHYTSRMGGATKSRWLKKMDALASATSAEIAGRTRPQTVSQRQAAAIKLRNARLATIPGVETAAANKAAVTRKKAASAKAKATAAKTVKADRAKRAAKAAKARKAR